MTATDKRIQEVLHYIRLGFNLGPSEFIILKKVITILTEETKNVQIISMDDECSCAETHVEETSTVKATVMKQYNYKGDTFRNNRFYTVVNLSKLLQ